MVDLGSPIALYSIPAAWFLAYYPHFKLIAIASKFSTWDNVTPRNNVERVKAEKKAPPKVIAQLERLRGAHFNGLEILPLWAIAVLAGTFAGVENYTLNKYSLIFLTIRTTYNYAYTNTASQGLSSVRSMIWMSSVAVSFMLVHKAVQAIAAN